MVANERSRVTLFTIGFTGKSAKKFFGLLQSAGVRTVLDTRLNNKSQLAGFSKGSDLPYFLEAIGRIAYRYVPEMAPTQELLDAFRKGGGAWASYERDYLKLVADRSVEARIDIADLHLACLLCSEHLPTHCHRRLVAEYLKLHYPQVDIVHLT